MYARIGQLAYLATIEPVPLPTTELLKEGPDIPGMHEVDESVAHIAFVVDV